MFARGYASEISKLDGSELCRSLSQDFQDETRDRLGGSDGEEQADAIEARPNLPMTLWRLCFAQQEWFNPHVVNLKLISLLPLIFSMAQPKKPQSNFLPEEAIGDYDSNPFLLNAKVGCKGLIFKMVRFAQTVAKLSIPYSPCMEYLLTFSNINLGKCRQIGKYSIHGAFGHCYVMFTMVVWAYLLAVTARLAYHPFAAVFVETFHVGELVHHVAFAKTLSVGRCMLLLDLSNCTQLQSQP